MLGTTLNDDFSCQASFGAFVQVSFVLCKDKQLFQKQMGGLLQHFVEVHLSFSFCFWFEMIGQLFCKNPKVGAFYGEKEKVRTCLSGYQVCSTLDRSSRAIARVVG